MGAWGREPFENDGAHDWLLERDGYGSDAALCASAFDGVIGVEDYLEVDMGQRVVAAAAWMAGARDGDLAALPELPAWRGDPPTATDCQRAAAALDRILLAPTSELAELWDESPDGALWRVSLAALKSRLR